MSLFNRAPRVIDNSTGQVVNARHSGGGDCKYTWGTCDVRSNQPPENKVLPHVCGEGNMRGHKHVCVACGKPQV